MTWKPILQTLESCPICRSGNIEDISLDQTYYVRAFQQAMTAKLGFCHQCEFMFHLNPFDDETMARYYGGNAQLRSLNTDVVEEHVHARQAEFLANGKPLKGKRVLEIGANTGRFLNHLKLLHGCAPYFDELNLEARRLLIDVQGLNPVEDLGGDGKLDVIVMRHVLEHIVMPVEYLSGLKGRLSGDGMLFIEVPDFSFFDSRTDTLLFEHVNYFSQATLFRALDAAGYLVVGQEFSVTDDYVTCSDRVLRMLARPKPIKANEEIPAAMRRNQNERVGKTNKKIERMVDEAGEGSKVAFYAASWLAERVLLNTSLGDGSVIAIFDKDKKKHGTVYHGIEVRPPSDVQTLKPDMIFILTSFEREIKKDLKLMNYEGQIVTWSELLEAVEN